MLLMIFMLSSGPLMILMIFMLSSGQLLKTRTCLLLCCGVRHNMVPFLFQVFLVGTTYNYFSYAILCSPGVELFD